MSGMKEDHEQKANEKIKKQFIREQLRPQRRKNIFRVIRKIAYVLCAAVLFGGIAALSFYIMQLYFPWQDLEESVAVATPNRVSKSPEVNEHTVSEEIDEETLATIEDYDKISQQLAAIGQQANTTIVRLGFEDVSESSIFEGTTLSQDYCGILFHETSRYYFVLTEYAAAQSGGQAVIEFQNGGVVEGFLAGCDAEAGMAVFRIDKSDFTKEEQQSIVIAELGDATSLSLGNYVLAVGKPNGNLYSVHTGQITDQSIAVPVTDRELQIYTMSMPYQTGRTGFILNIQGQLIGMLVTHIDVPGEIDTAFISLSDLTTDINLMLQGKTVPYLGITGTDVDSSEAESLGLVTGIYIDTVESRSPAYQGKMRVADILTEIDGYSVQTLEELHEYLTKCQSGQELVVTVYRQSNTNNQKKKLKITLQ